MSNIAKIFSVRGYADTQSIPNEASIATAQLLLTDDEKAAIIIASAPMLGIRIEERSDCNITKSLAGDFLISSFGDSPVKISIDGMNIIRQVCSNKSATGDYPSITDFFDKNKVSTDIKKRVKLIIATSANTKKTYNCAIIGFDTVLDTEYNEYGSNRYSLHLIGVISK